jgi:hypothetical protein
MREVRRRREAGDRMSGRREVGDSAAADTLAVGERGAADREADLAVGPARGVEGVAVHGAQLLHLTGPLHVGDRLRELRVPVLGHGARRDRRPLVGQAEEPAELMREGGARREDGEGDCGRQGGAAMAALLPGNAGRTGVDPAADPGRRGQARLDRVRGGEPCDECVCHGATPSGCER